MQENPVMPDRLNLFQRIRYSIFPGTLQKPTYYQRYRNFFNSLIFHFRPRSVQERTLRFTLTWGLGGMAVVLVCILFGTGLMLKFVYQPVPDRAYASIVHLQNNVAFGELVRNMHHWGGNTLLIIVFLHFLRVFFTGAFHPPRQFNWIIGLAMFLAVLTSNITGYLLPWDQLAFWAITICTGMLEYIPGIGQWLQGLIRGGSDIGPATLSIFFAIHTAVIPASLLILMPFHFWRVRKAGGLVIPRSPDEDASSRGDSVPTIPNLILRELVVAVVLIAFIMLVSVVFNAPLGAEANPGALVFCRHPGTVSALSPAVCAVHHTASDVDCPGEHSLLQLSNRDSRGVVRFPAGPAPGSAGCGDRYWCYADRHHFR
jgi:quinol-cytochrome oxidoreductase complex cytochrome b subunit